MATAEVTPTSIALAATIGGYKATHVSLRLSEIPADEPVAQDVFKGTTQAASNFVRALRGSDTGCNTTTVAEILAGALAGVTLLTNGAAYTAPELRDVAHFSNFAEEIDFPVNTLIARTFQAAAIGVDDFALPPHALEAAKLTGILSGVMAEIYFTHIAEIREVRSSLLASLRLVQCIKTVTCPAEPGRIIPTQLMVDTLMDARHIVPLAYRDSSCSSVRVVPREHTGRY